MNLNQGLVDLVAVALVAALAPLMVAVLPGPRIPQVVIFLLGGVLIGPHVLGVAETSSWPARSGTVQRIIREGEDATGQTTLRWAVVLLFLLLAIASRFGLDVVLGALLAGIVLRAWTRRFNMDTAGLEHKFDAVGYGIFIPIFFVSSGMTLDLKAISQDPLRLLVLFLLLIARGLPSLLVYRRALPGRQRAEMTFITATALPLLIALVEIGQRDGVHRDRRPGGESRSARSGPLRRSFRRSARGC